MFRRLSLKQKIVSLVTLAAIFPIFTMLVISTFQSNAILKNTAKEIDESNKNYLTQIVNEVYVLCKIANDFLKEDLVQNLKVAQNIIQHTGPIRLDKQMVSWAAIDTAQRKTVLIELPKMYIGDQWLGQNFTLSEPTPIIDEIVNITGGISSIYQRMNEQGDMLAIATNRNTTFAERSIGVYLPSAYTEDQANPIIAAVLRGEDYLESDSLPTGVFLMMYSPLRDESGAIVGMLSVGVKQEPPPNLKKAIYDIKFGKTGYVFVLGAKGDDMGRYLISSEGMQDGEKIYDVVDSHGKHPVREVISQATQLKGDETATFHYEWKNSLDDKTSTKITVVKYWKPWEWIIGAGMQEEDYYYLNRLMNVQLNKSLLWIFLSGTLLFAIVIALAFLLANKIVKLIVGITQITESIGQGNLFQAKIIAGSLETPEMTEAKEQYTIVQDAFFVDESEKLLYSTINMAEKLYILVSRMQQSGKEVRNSTAQIAEASKKLTSTATDEAVSVKEVVATTKEISSTAQQLAMTMTQVKDIATSTASYANDGKNKLNIVEATIRLFVEATVSIASKLMVIRDKTKDINSVVFTINNVAEQTNLISLNAAIEAERAGEYGRGFAVVAREIRRLADQTAMATFNIEFMIDGMHSAVSSGITEVEKFTKEVEKGVTTIKVINEQLEKIIEEVQVLPQRFEVVNQGVQFQSTSAKEISLALSQLSDSMRIMTEALNNFNNITEELNHTASSLNDEVSHFKITSPILYDL